MKASDFRIGNYVMLNGQIITIKPRDIDRIAEQEYFGITSSYSPIEITEEWLFKFGFDKTVYNKSIHEYRTSFHPNNAYISVRFGEMIDNPNDLNDVRIRPEFSGTSYLINNIKYVHQLQNLYFALTGEELTIKT